MFKRLHFLEVYYSFFKARFDTLDLCASCGFLVCSHIAAVFPGNGSGWGDELTVFSYATHPTPSSQILQLPWSQIWNLNLHSKLFVYWSAHEREQEQHLISCEEGKTARIRFHNQP